MPDTEQVIMVLAQARPGLTSDALYTDWDTALTLGATVAESWIASELEDDDLEFHELTEPDGARRCWSGGNQDGAPFIEMTSRTVRSS